MCYLSRIGCVLPQVSSRDLVAVVTRSPRASHLVVFWSPSAAFVIVREGRHCGLALIHLECVLVVGPESDRVRSFHTFAWPRELGGPDRMRGVGGVDLLPWGEPVEESAEGIGVLYESLGQHVAGLFATDSSGRVDGLLLRQTGAANNGLWNGACGIAMLLPC